MLTYRRTLSGIYCLVFQSGHFYYGQSIDIKRRFYHHCHYLRQGSHTNSYMLAIFRKYGLPALRIECLANAGNLTWIEQEYIDASADNPYSLNLAKQVLNPLLGRVLSEDQQRQIADAIKARWAEGRYSHVDYSRNTQRLISPEQLAVTAQWNRDLWRTEAYREKQRLARMAWLESEACRQHLAANRQLTIAPKANAKRSATLKAYYANHPEVRDAEKKKSVMRKNLMNRARRVCLDGVIYESIIAAEKALGYKRCSGAVERIIRLYPERACYVDQCQSVVDPPVENL